MLLRRALPLLIGVLASEALLQLAALGSERVRTRLDPPSWRLDDAVLGHRPTPGRPGRDALGYRNPSRLTSADIVGLGDSMTEAREVPRDQTWLSLVGQQLGRTVYNMGVGRWSPPQYSVVIDEALALTPQVVVVQLYTGNDFADAFDLVWKEGKLEHLRGTDPNRVAEIETALREAPDWDDVWLETRAGLGWRPVEPPSMLRRHSRLVQLLATARRAVRGPSATAGGQHEHRSAAGLPADLALVAKLPGATTILTPEVRRQVTDPEDSRVEEGFDIVLRALSVVRKRCPPNTKLVIAVMPTKETVYYEPLRRQGNPIPSTLDQLVAGERHLVNELRGALEKEGTRFVDWLPALRGVLQAGENPYPESSNQHPNARGHRAMAEAIHAVLVE